MEKCFHIKKMKNLVLLIFNIQIIIHNDYTFINIIIIIIFIELNDIASFKEQIYTKKNIRFQKIIILLKNIIFIIMTRIENTFFKFIR